MSGRLMRWYAAAGFVGLVYVGVWVYMGFGSAVIQVQWGYFPELEGSEVMIDGEVAGVLFRRGRQTLSGFRVGRGDHAVSIVHPEYASDTFVVSADLRGAQYLLFAFERRRRIPEGLEVWIGLGPRVPD
ncbi:MAG: hypothetical protein RJQ04_13985 [Longimicrobiales bacterium]